MAFPLVVLMVLAGVSLALCALSHAALRVKQRARAARSGPTPPISILKPLKGVDEALYENLASLARQDYPCFELVLGAEDPCDSALEVARKLRSDFPHVAIQVVAGAAAFGRNPKVTNLATLSRRARHGHWLISDSNVRVGPDYLRHLAAELADPEVGLVHSLIAGVGDRSTGALLENLHLNGFIAPMVAGAELVAGVPTVVGKSMLFHRDDLHALGGWARVRHVLAEDYVLGRAFEGAGHRVALSPYPVETVNHTWSISRFLERHIRWGQMRRHICPSAFLAEPLSNPTLWMAALLAVAVAERSGLAALLALAGQFVKIGLDATAHAHLQKRPPPLAVLWAAPLKDLLIALAWPVAAFKPTVCWRGNQARITTGSVLLPPRTTPRTVPATPAEEAA